MKRLLFILSFFFIASACYSQYLKFHRTYFGQYSEANCLQQIPGQNYIITGTDSSHINLTKSDPNGNILWSRDYLMSYSTSMGFSGQQTADKGLIVYGTTSDNTGWYSDYLVKTDSNGNALWSKKYLINMPNEYYAHGMYQGTGEGLSLMRAKQTMDRGFVIMQEATNVVNLHSLIHVIKTDSNGVIQWAREYDSFNAPYDIVPATNNANQQEYIIAGAGVTLICLNNLGGIKWSKIYDDTLHHMQYMGGFSVTQSADKGFVVAGACMSSQFPQHEILLMKTDSAGATQWAWDYQSDKMSWINSIQEVTGNDYGFILGGVYGEENFNYGQFMGKAVLLKTGGTGSLQWCRQYGYGFSNECLSVTPTYDGGYAFVGHHKEPGYSGNIGMLFVKTDNSGHTECYDSVLSLIPIPLTIISTNTGTSTAANMVATPVNTFYEYPSLQNNLVCTITAVEEKRQDDLFQIFPNPSAGHFIVQSSKEIKSLMIYDVLGNLIISSNTSRKEFDLSGEPDGIYFVRIDTGYLSVSRRVIKAH